jgi:osmoprotectant transport system substrate-binding protein
MRFLFLLVFLSACSSKTTITVGSKNFTEQILLGEIVAQHLEHRLGQKVNRKLDLGGTLLAHQALLSGQIDVYPEYTGTALLAILKQKPAEDPATVFRTVQEEYRRRWRLDWLPPLGFNNTFAMVIRGEDARARGVRTLSQAASYQPGWALGVGYEFLQRADGLPGLLKVYPLHLTRSPISMDLGLLYRALQQKQVDMVAASSTDGALSVLDVTVLEDDRHYFPPYQAALVMREDKRELREALAELSGKFNDEMMRKLNYQVDGEHRPVREVAAGFLSAAGIR